MTRKESEKDSERPHYYSQFWLDVAAGRRIIGVPKNDEGDLTEAEASELTPPRRASRGGQVEAENTYNDGHTETIAHPVAEPIVTPEEFIEPEPEEEDLVADEAEDLDFQNAPVEDIEIPDMDLEEEPLEDEEEEEDLYADEEEEEEEEWAGGRSRKKSKPTRATKPQPPKKSRRDQRRGSY